MNINMIGLLSVHCDLLAGTVSKHRDFLNAAQV